MGRIRQESSHISWPWGPTQPVEHYLTDTP